MASRIYTHPAMKPSVDTELALRKLLTEAANGDLIGIVYAAMYRKREYEISVTGECRRSRVLTRGMVASISDHPDLK